MKSNIVVGLDIGTTKIAVMVAQKNEFGKIDILGYGATPSMGVMRGSVFNIDKTVESIKTAVELAELKSGVKIREVYVGIAGQHIKSFQRRGEVIRANDEEITEQEIRDLCQRMEKIQVDPGESILHVIPQEFIIDDFHGIREPVGMSGRTLAANFHIITGQASAIKNIARSVQKAGLVLKDLILEPLASADAVLDEKDCEAGVALVDIGGGTTDIAIYHGHLLRHTAVVPLGGNVITDDIRDGCVIVEQQARTLKEKFGSALQSENKEDAIVSIPGLRGRAAKEISLKNLAGIIQARMEDILDGVLFEIKSSGYEKKLIAGIVLTGGGAMLKHVSQLTEYVTHIDTRIGYPNEHLSAGMDDTLANPAFATAVGLVIRGLEDAQPLNSPPCEEEKIAIPSDSKKSPVPTPSDSRKNRGGFFDSMKGLKDKLGDFMKDTDD